MTGPNPYPGPVVPLAQTGRPIPASVLRTALGAVCGALMAVLVLDGAPSGYLVLLSLMAAASVLSPGSAATAALIGGAVLALVMVDPDGSDPLRPAVLAVVVLGHLAHVLAGIAALVPLNSWLHLPALRRPLVRFALIQAAVLALAALTVVLPGGQNSALLEVIAVLGVAALVSLAVVLLRRR